MDQLGNVQDFEGNFVSSDMRGHGTHTLLAGGHDRFRPRIEGLFNFLFRDLRGQLGVDHFQVSATAAAGTVFPVAGKFNQFNSGNGSDDVSRFLKDTRSAAKIAGVVVGDLQIQLLQGNEFTPDKFH